MVRKLEWETKSAASKQPKPTIPTTSTSSAAKPIVSNESPIVTITSHSTDDSGNAKEIFEFFFDEFEEDFVSMGGREILDQKIRTLFIALITQCMQDLLILSNVCRPFVGEMGPSNLNHRTLEERFGYEVGTSYDDFRINMPYMNLHKVQKEIKTILKILSNVANELDTSGCFNSLETHVIMLEIMMDDENKLLRNLLRKRAKIQTLKKAKRKEKQFLMKQTMRSEENLQKIFALVQDELDSRKSEVSVTYKWENARQEQNSMVLKDKENGYNLIYQQMIKQTDLEQFCHKNIEEFILETQNDYQEEIFYWMTHYDEEIDKRDLEIVEMKQKVERLGFDLEKLHEVYEQRCTEMEEWLKYKAIKEEKERILEMQTQACIKIQAWWRGVMVRRKLGPYRKRRKGKNKGKNKGGKAAGGKKKKK